MSASEDARRELMQIASAYDARVVGIQPDSLIIQITDVTDKLEEFVNLMKTYGVIELARTGSVALVRSSRPTAS